MRTRTILLPALSIAVLIGTSACGSSAVPSSSGPPAAARPSVAASAPETASMAPTAATNDWLGFRGDAGHTGVAPAGPVGHPVVNWQYHAKAPVPHAIAIVGDQVSFASDDGTVYALDRATGKERWVVKAGAPTLIGPFAGEGRLYFLNGAGAAIALDATSGRTLWTSEATYDSTTEPVVDHGTMYLGTHDGRIVAIDGATGTEAWSVKPAPSTEWVGNPAVADGRVYAGTNSGLVAVDTATHQAAWIGDTHGESTGTAAVDAGIAFIATGGDASAGSIRAFDAASGELRWTSTTQLLTFPVTADGLALSSTMQGLVQGLDLQTGAVHWSIQLSGKIRPMAVANHVLYVAADTEHRLYAIDAATGGKLWQLDVDGENDCCVAVADGAVFVGTLAGTIYSIGGDGAAVAAVPFGSAAPSGAPSQAPGPIVLDVKVTWTADLSRLAVEPSCQIAIGRDGRIWAPVANGGTIAVFGPDGRQLETWGTPGSGSGQFEFKRANGDGYGTLAFGNDGSFYVLDVGNRRVQHFDASRKLVGEWGGFGDEAGQFNDPVGIAVAPDGSVWVLDDQRMVVEHYDPTGRVLGSFDPSATQPMPEGANSLAIDAKGMLYVSTVAPSRILQFDPSGKLIRSIGEGTFIEQAGAMAIDADGRVYTTQGPDRANQPGILVFAADGSLLGGFGPEGDGDGQLVFTGGIALDGKGGVIVEDSLPESARLIRFELPASLR